MSKSTNVFSPLRPDWLRDVNGVGYDSEFWEIINFYLLHSLCDRQSWKGHTLSGEYHWKTKPWKPDSYLKDKIIRAIWRDKDCHLYMADKHEALESKIKDKNLDGNFYLDAFNQRAGYVMVSKGKENKSQIMSLLYHIRNALAHGRYGFVPISDDDYMIFMEDGQSDGEQFAVTARIALKKSSLMKIREIIRNGPDEDPDYAAEILASIKNGKNKKKMIIEDLKISDNIWNKYIDVLSSENLIQYDNCKKIWKII